MGKRKAKRKTPPPPAYEIEYPSDIALPSPGFLVASFRQAALEASEETTMTDVIASSIGDQVYLEPAGLLSLEQVWLPLLARQENEALKLLQARVQRDSPQHVHILKETRQMIYYSVGEAIKHARLSRLKRQAEKSRQQGLQQEQKQQEQRREHLKLLKHQYPPNENLRQEIAQLTAGKSKLEEELRQWEEIERQQDQQEAAQQARDDTTKANKTEPQIQEVEIPMDDFLLQLQGLVEDISISSTRIQKGLSIVLKSVDESDQLREQLDQTISSTRKIKRSWSVISTRRTKGTLP
jgi:hypothetical protein